MIEATRRLSLAGRRILRTVGAASFGVVCCSAGSVQAADSDDRESRCLDAYEAGQRARNQGALREAKDQFALCGGETCPQALHSDCSRWLDEVESALPSAVFHVVGPNGSELAQARIVIDGAPPQALDGRAISFDPGEHTLAFEREGHRPVEQHFTFVEGEKMVSHRIALEPLPAAPAPRPARVAARVDRRSGSHRASLTPTWIGLGVGVLGVAGFALWGSAARRDDHALDECSPRCSNARASHVQAEYVGANVSLAVGAAAFLAAGGWALFRPSMTAPEDERAELPLELRIGTVSSFTYRF